MITAITANLWRSLALLLAGMAFALLVQIHGLPIIGGGLKAELASEQRAHLETQKRYAQVQADAAERARAYRLSEEARYRLLAQRTDNQHAKEIDAALAAARRYADDHRCAPAGLRAQAAGRAGSAAGTGATGGSAESADRSGGAAQLDVIALVGVTEDDLRICTTNTQRLIDAQAWAESLP